MEEKLLDYLDGTLPPAAAQALEERLKTDTRLRNQLARLTQAEKYMQAFNTHKPVPDAHFTHQVMQCIRKHPQAQVTPSIYRGVLLMAASLFAGVAICVLLYAGYFDHVASLNLNRQFLHQYIHQSVPIITLRGTTIAYVILAGNLILAWLVLDKTVLKPWFQRPHVGI